MLALPGKVVWCTPTRGLYQLGASFDPTMEAPRRKKLDILLKLLSCEVQTMRQRPVREPE